MAKSKKPRKRTAAKIATPNKLDRLASGSFSLNILRLAEYSVMHVLNGQVTQDKTQLKRYFKTLDSPRQWGITYGVLRRDTAGDWQITHNFMLLKARWHFAELDDVIQECMSEAVDEVDYREILSPYYIASPEGRDFTAEQVFDIIDRKNAFKRLNNINELEAERHQGIEELKAVSILPYLPKSDKGLASVLKSHGLTSLFEIRMQDKSGLLALKGISEKRYLHIEKAFADTLLQQPDKFPHFIKFLQMKDQFDHANQYMEKYIA